MMAMEGGLSLRMQVMESLNVFMDAYEDVLRACEKLETYYKTEKIQETSVDFKRTRSN